MILHSLALEHETTTTTSLMMEMKKISFPDTFVPEMKHFTKSNFLTEKISNIVSANKPKQYVLHKILHIGSEVSY